MVIDMLCGRARLRVVRYHGHIPESKNNIEIVRLTKIHRIGGGSKKECLQTDSVVASQKNLSSPTCSTKREKRKICALGQINYIHTR